jgi:hypothetical protein
MRPVARFVIQYEQSLIHPRASGRMPISPSNTGCESGVGVGHSPLRTAIGTSSQ